jgi:methionyl-tRNA formyltransferase
MKMNFAFFGTDDISVAVLDELKSAGLTPLLIVTQPDRPAGRHLKLSPPPTKVWAVENKIAFLQPEDLNDPNFTHTLKAVSYRLFIVASYGFLIPKSILDLPAQGVLNIHPSLLPKYRGPTPVRSAILEDDKKTGVTVMRMSEKMDAGPLLAQEAFTVDEWPQAPVLEKELARQGARLLIKILPDYLMGRIAPTPQGDTRATFTRKLEKKDAEINLADDPRRNFLTIQAHAGSAPAFFFAERGEKKIRVSIKSAEFKNGKLTILRVVPEGRREMNYEEFLRGAR